MAHVLCHSGLTSGLKVPDGLLLGSGIAIANAFIEPQEIYDGGLGGKDIRLRIVSGEAGQSGLIGAWANSFIQYWHKETKEAIEIAWYLGDTVEGLGFLDAGEVDIAVTHDESTENQAFESDNVALRVPCFRDYFILVGPKSNPANIQKDDDIYSILNKIVDQGNLDVVVCVNFLFGGMDGFINIPQKPPEDRASVRFLSLYDKSAINVKESTLFIAIGQVPWALAYSKWYHQYPRSSLEGLWEAAKSLEYTLTDRRTWLSVSQHIRDALDIFAGVAENLEAQDERLQSFAHVLLGVNPKNKDVAEKFVDWVRLREGGKKVIDEFTKGGEQLYLSLP